MNPNLVYLVQTDTTAGFLSQNAQALSKAKGRDPHMPFLMSVSSFAKQKGYVRTPKRFRKEVRRARKTTYLYPCKKAVRVVGEGKHHRFLKKFTFMYSTSANAHGARFALSYALQKADVIVEDGAGFFEGAPSSIFRLGRRKKIALR
ncbi:MAG TPA: Sua5 YciO YrdC YwlC family protein [Campylobacteraceae bacterium]|nr:Sua5 YciO YrdC YwlC family protein [Campylobacteraceae bacterium]HHD84146.1 Sua5 YciO YrdC YwlC family protein [Campylobacteraceae bacterium]